MIREFRKEDWFEVTDPMEPGIVMDGDMSVFDHGIGITAYDDNGIVLCVGILDDGEMWLRVSRSASKKTIFSITKDWCRIFADIVDWTDKKCHVHKDFTISDKLVKRLGFIPDKMVGDYMEYKWQTQ